MKRLALLFALVTTGLMTAHQARPAEAQEGKLRALIVTGQNNHNWRVTTPHIKQFLEATGRFTVDVTEDPEMFMLFPRRLNRYDVLVLNYNGPRWGDAAWGYAAEKTFMDAVRGGKAVSVIHAANNAFPGWDDYDRLVGIAWRSTAGHGAYHEFNVKYTVKDHPITQGLTDMQKHPDELYHRLTPAPNEPMTVIATAFSDPATRGTGKDEPMALVKSHGKARVFHTALGHDLRSMQDPQFMLLVSRGTEWAATGKVTIKTAPVVK
jgi:uncharacterized protein